MAISPIQKALLLGMPTLGTRLPRFARNDNTDFEKALAFAGMTVLKPFICDSLAARSSLTCGGQ